jgi:acetyl esterase/lipase/pectate lyase
MNTHRAVLLGLLGLLSLSTISDAADALASPPANEASGVATFLPAFPGAEGAGARATGGRGGTVYEVTTLNDSGPGSLREAVSESNRTIVFRVSGTIELKSRLELNKPNITIAGQTAPGDGICLSNYSFNIRTQNVIVRYLRVRLGDVTAQQSDGVTIWRGSRNVILDHCSVSWSIDEALSLAGDVADVTVQWCLIGEALRRSKHAKGAHGYGSLSRASGAVSWHHNLWAHNDSRNPRLGDNYNNPPYPTFDVRNNVMYDYGSTCSGLTQGQLKVNYVANYIKRGPSSTATHPISVGGPSDMYFYIRDNQVDGNEALTADNSKFFNKVEIDGKRQVQTVAEPFAMPLVRTSSAREAYDAVLVSVGASLPIRDVVDARLVREVRERKGRMIDSQTEVGGWPELKSAPAPADSDHDGMSNDWERKHMLNPDNASDGVGDTDKDGYTDIEEYLNNTDPTQYIDYRDLRNNFDSFGARAFITNPNIEYGRAGGESLLLDVHVPEGKGPFPVAILVHGGGWGSGHKQGDISALFKPLSDANFTWFSLDYRLAPQHRWPASYEDVQVAIRWAKAHAAKYKGDPQRIALIGYSAGGQLITRAAVLAKEDTQVQAVVGVAAPTDMVSDTERRGGLSKALQDLLNRESVMTEETRTILNDLSAINFVKPGLPPFLLLHGTADKSVPYEQSLNFQKRLAGMGVRCDLITVENAPHAIAEWERIDPSYKHKIAAWLVRTLHAENTSGTIDQ